MKRIFIAVGSEALKALSALVKRLCEENLFNQFQDQYIAVDSMSTEVVAFNALGERLHTPRVKGYVLTIDPQDEKVRESFRQDWVVHGVPAGGVGGDRTISAKAVKFIHDIWRNPDLGLDADLQPEDQICVIGSAFGGTAGGMFLNVCEYLDQVIRVKRNVNDRFQEVAVDGFLLMPEPVSSKSERGYPIATNMIEMFRDLQTASWRRRLASCRPGFKVPVWAQLEGNAFPVFNRTRQGAHLIQEYGIQGSSLPMSNLYLLPSPRPRSLFSQVAAESIFAATYLKVMAGFEWTVDRQISGGQGMRDDLSVEDPCLLGLNMFAMKSGRIISLKNWFYNGILNVFHDGTGVRGLMTTGTANGVIADNIKVVFRSAQVPERESDYSGLDPRACSALKTLLDAEANAKSTLKNLREFKASLGGLLDALYSSVPSFDTIPAKELIVLLSSKKFRDWNREVNFPLIEKGYRAFHTELSQHASERTACADSMRGALDRAIACAEARLRSRVVSERPWGLGLRDAVFSEVANVFHAKFMALLRNYIFSSRCAKTAFITPEVFEHEVADFRLACVAWKAKVEQKQRDLRSAQNPYVIDGQLVEDLQPLPEAVDKELAFDPFRIAMSVVYRQCVTGPVQNLHAANALVATGDSDNLLLQTDLRDDQVFEMVEETTINRYIELADQLQPGVNPLTKATLRDFTAVRNSPPGCKTYATEFAIPDSGRDHCHFVIQQGPSPQMFRMTNGDVASSMGLGLSTMPNTTDTAQDFLSCNHALGMQDSRFWKDSQTAESPMFAGACNPNAIRVQGLWLGTLGTAFTVHEMLAKLYDSVPNVRLDWIRSAMNAPYPKRLMSLRETILFGLVVEAVEAKVKESWMSYTLDRPNSVLLDTSNVKISFEHAGRTFVLPEAMLKDMGFVESPETGVSLASISLEWTGLILSWIRNQADGFKSFYPAAAFTLVEKTEADIFMDLKFSIAPEIQQEMDQVVQVIKNSIRIQGL